MGEKTAKRSGGFFKAIGKSQTYLNILYLLFSFPLSLIYFICIIVGVSLGLGLFITWFGIPILVGVMYMWVGFAYFERELSSSLFRINIPYDYTPEVKINGFWKKLKRRVADSNTWKSLCYLILKFPLGIVSFVVLITFTAVTLGLISTPVIYYLTQIGLIDASCVGSEWCALLYNWPTVIIVGLIGILMIFVSLAVFNGIAHVSRFFAREMLKKESIKKTRKHSRKLKRKSKR